MQLARKRLPSHKFASIELKKLSRFYDKAHGGWRIEIIEWFIQKVIVHPHSETPTDGLGRYNQGECTHHAAQSLRM